jgi:hypothetical protein
LNSTNSAREDVHVVTEENAEVSYWPNDVSDKLHIKTDGSFDNVAVIDAIGRQHLSESVSGKKEITLDVSNLASGVHFVKLHGWDKHYVFRIIKR